MFDTPLGAGKPSQLADIDEAMAIDRDARRHGLATNLVRQAAEIGSDGGGVGQPFNALMFAVDTNSSGNTASTLMFPSRSMRNKSLPPASTTSAACGPRAWTSYGFESGAFWTGSIGFGAAVCGLNALFELEQVRDLRDSPFLMRCRPCPVSFCGPAGGAPVAPVSAQIVPKPAGLTSVTVKSGNGIGVPGLP